MAQFASIWAVKVPVTPDAPYFEEGSTIPVNLKSGAVKQVKLHKFLYATKQKDGRAFAYYLSEKEDA